MSHQPQYMDALERANEVRLERARVKRDVATGRMSLAAAMGSPCCGTLCVADLLMCQRRWGRIRALRTLRTLRIGEHREVCSLTDRQRALLVRVCCGERSLRDV
jgi:hypothetical protein